MTSRIAGSRRPETSLIICAPRRRHSSATSGFIVSIEIGIGNSFVKTSSTGVIRRNSSSVEIRGDPGREDSPPISIISAPAATRARAWTIASIGVKNLPPSLKLSGVILRMPARRGRSKKSVKFPQLICCIEYLYDFARTYFMVSWSNPLYQKFLTNGSRAPPPLANASRQAKYSLRFLIRATKKIF